MDWRDVEKGRGEEEVDKVDEEDDDDKNLSHREASANEKEEAEVEEEQDVAITLALTTERADESRFTGRCKVDVVFAFIKLLLQLTFLAYDVVIEVEYLCNSASASSSFPSARHDSMMILEKAWLFLH